MKTGETQYCSICQGAYAGYGHNAEPINSGRCCTDCNQMVVVARLRLMMREVNDNRRSQVKAEVTNG